MDTEAIKLMRDEKQAGDDKKEEAVVPPGGSNSLSLRIAVRSSYLCPGRRSLACAYLAHTVSCVIAAGLCFVTACLSLSS